MSYNDGGNFDHGVVAKGGFVLGAALFVVGVAGEYLGNTLFEPLPAGVDGVLLGMTGIGILVALLVPVVFGIVLPLVE